jgi:hypothetical protein
VSPDFDPHYNAVRWVAYFDLLGTRELIRRGRYQTVFHAYQKAIEQLQRRNAEQPQVQYAWFSDTFILMTRNDSGQALTEIESVARWFAYFLITAQIPLRGAISFGSMYCDFSNRIFIGEALVEAYEYGEGQDWVGFVLSPSAAAEMQRLGVPVDNRLHYALYEPVWKASTGPNGAPDRLGACILGSWLTNNGQNPCLQKLRLMAQNQKPHVRVKYERAIQFIEQNPRRPFVEPTATATNATPVERGGAADTLAERTCE